jgi:hypothetical protein
LTIDRWLKTLAVAAILLMVIVLGVFYRQVPHAKKPFARAAEQTAKIRIAYGAASVLEFEKKEDGWQVRAGTSTVSYPVEATKIESLLGSLSNVQVEDAISDRAERAADFEVTDASGTRVTAIDKKGKPWADALFGKQAPNFTNVYFRYPDQPTVYLARGLVRGELGTVKLEEWRQKDLVDIAETDMQQITLTTKGQTIDLVRSSETWTANGKNVNLAPVYGLIGTLAHLQADDFMDDPGAQTFDAQTIAVKGASASVILQIGSTGGKAGRVPVRVKDGAAYWLNAEKVKSLQLSSKDLGI